MCLLSGVTAAFFVSESGSGVQAHAGRASQMSVMGERAQTCDALPSFPRLHNSSHDLQSLAFQSLASLVPPSSRLFHGQLPHPISLSRCQPLSPSILYVPNKKIIITTDSMSEVGQTVRRSGICSSAAFVSALCLMFIRCRILGMTSDTFYSRPTQRDMK